MDDEESWWGGDESGHEHYRARMAAVRGADAYARWKIETSSRNFARQFAGARNSGRAAWIAVHGSDELLWPLTHPPAGVWIPKSATAVCLRYFWFDRSPAEAGDAAGSARRHSLEHQPAPNEAALQLLMAPVAVYAYPQDREGRPRFAG